MCLGRHEIHTRCRGTRIRGRNNGTQGLLTLPVSRAARSSMGMAAVSSRGAMLLTYMWAFSTCSTRASLRYAGRPA